MALLPDVFGRHHLTVAQQPGRSLTRPSVVSRRVPARPSCCGAIARVSFTVRASKTFEVSRNYREAIERGYAEMAFARLARHSPRARIGLTDS
jgi:hypothetical protein